MHYKKLRIRRMESLCTWLGGAPFRNLTLNFGPGESEYSILLFLADFRPFTECEFPSMLKVCLAMHAVSY